MQVRIPDYPSKTVSIDGMTSSHTYKWRISSSILIRDLKVRNGTNITPTWNVRLLVWPETLVHRRDPSGSCGSSICWYDSGMSHSSYRPVLWRIAFVVVPDGDMKDPSISILLKRFLLATIDIVCSIQDTFQIRSDVELYLVFRCKFRRSK